MTTASKLAMALCTFLLPLAASAGELKLTASADRAELTSGAQRVVFERSAGNNSPLDVLIQVRDGDKWRPMFDGKRPIVSGSLFDLKPTSVRVVEDSTSRKAILLAGKHENPSYDFDLLVEAATSLPTVKFFFTAHLKDDLTLNQPQPVVALWSKKPSLALTVNQGPESIYDKLGIPRCMGFPAAYAWDDGAEAVIFFDMQPSTWMGPKGLWRFLDMTIASRPRDGMTGMGMQPFKLSGKTIPAGEMSIAFHLYAGQRAGKPTKLAALDTMVRVCAPLHPATSVIPVDRSTGKPASWTQITRHAIADLSKPGVMLFEKPAAWNDLPLKLVEPVTQVIRHPGGVGGDDGDFSCVNNHLTPWVLFARMNEDSSALEIGKEKVAALPLYYDPKAGLIRWGTREPRQVGDLEMSWQNFFFNTELLRAGQTLGPDQFDPAIAGRFLMGADGLIQLAHNVKYVFPQWFDPYNKQPVIQNDVPKLGKVREPYQAGTYANLMLDAYELSGEKRFADEARQSIETLLTRMSYTEDNEVYKKTFTDPAEFPITELFGNGYGAVAAYRIYQQSGDERYLQFSRDFLNGLLRLTFWYEDDADPVLRDLRNAGLFYPHAGAHVTCPWETTEANLAIAWLIENDRHNPILPLLLKLSNLNRINSFYYYPVTYTDRVAALDPTRRKDIGQNWPIEPFYTLEGNGGHRGPTAAYMANNAVWNWWMYEALATPADTDVMVLNTAVLGKYEQALNGAERRLVAFNPTDTARQTQIAISSLPAGDYTVEISHGGKNQASTVSAQSLAGKIELALAAGEYAYIRIAAVDNGPRDALRQAEAAQRALSHAYAALQSAAGRGDPARLSGPRDEFLAAMQAYRKHDYAAAADKARSLAAAAGKDSGQ